MKAILLAALVVTPLLVFLAPTPTSQTAGTVIGPGALGAFTREPTLIYDVTGFTLAGELHVNAVVYNDGLVSYSSRSGLFGVVEQACTVFVPPTDVKKLTDALAGAGAGTLPDKLLFVSDVPLQTVTFMKPATDTKAHSFSWYIAPGAYTAVQTIINDFLQKHVPDCPDGGVVQ